MIVGVHEMGQPIDSLYSAIERHQLMLQSTGPEDTEPAMQIFAKAKLSYHYHRDFRKTNELFGTIQDTNRVTTVIHCGYLVNLVSEKPGIAKVSAASLIEELDVAKFLGARYIVMHPGSVGEKGDRAAGNQKLLDSLRFILIDGDWPTKLLLETMPGGKHFSQIGCMLDELAEITTTLKEEGANIGTCFDTCHMFAAGYDFYSSREHYDAFWEQWLQYFDQWPSVFHVNGALNPAGSRKDGHATLNGHFDPNGTKIKPQIPTQLFTWLSNDPRFKRSAHILETPIQFHNADLAAYIGGDVRWEPNTH